MNLNLPQHHLLPAIVFCLFFSTSLVAQAPTVSCPATVVVVDDTTGNDTELWNTPTWWDPVISSHNLAEGGTVLEFSATDHCSFSGNLHFQYVLSLDLDRDSIFETFIDSDSLPGKNTVYFGNHIGHLLWGMPRPFDMRAVNPDQKWGFDLAVESNGSDHIAQMIWKNELGQIAIPQIPYGNHQIKWIVTDSCGASSECEYGFTIKDNQKPVVECINGLSVNLIPNPGCILQMWATDFLQHTSDNYTPINQLEIAIRRTGTGVGYPYNPNGTVQTGVSFNYCDLGTQLIELWSKDKDGNTEKCDAYVLIQDYAGVCDCFNFSVGGHILTENGEGISTVTVNLSGNNYGTPFYQSDVLTDNSGQYGFSNAVPLSGNAGVNPIMNLDPLNGVNAWDLILISRHILGLEPLASPYRLISADANQSGTVTTFDVVELRKLILGTYAALPNSKSWRFVDKSQVFSNPENPFADTLREHLAFSMLLNNLHNIDFTGCKIGDVDLTATPNNLTEHEERNDGLSTLSVQNRSFKKGETITVHFEAPPEIAGLQFTLNAKGLRPVRVIPGTGLTEDHFNMFSGGNETESAPALTAAFETGEVDFELQFVALTDGLLSDMLAISNEITPAMAFEKDGKRNDLVLRFEEEMAADQPVLFQNIPNPWTTSTRIPFYLPEEGFAEITVYNQQGMVVFSNFDYYTKGNHQVLLNYNQHYSSGVYLYQLKTAGLTATRKTTFIQN